MIINPSALAKIIDHTALRPETTDKQIVQLCKDAGEFGFGAVCIAPIWVTLAVKTLGCASTKVATVVGFPHGNVPSNIKTFEAMQAINSGANELDVVINIGALKSGNQEVVFQDIQSVVHMAKKSGIIIKAIIETSLLTDDEKVLASQLVEKAGADFVKTSTGFTASGATVRDVALIKRTVGNRLGVKASGGIRDLATALAMIEAGATRLGCSSSVSILKEFH